MELLSLYLGLEQLKDRTNKSSTMSQALRSTDIPVFVDPYQGINKCYAFLSLQLRIIVELIGVAKQGKTYL
jgi:hypothetical protein